MNGNVVDWPTLHDAYHALDGAGRQAVDLWFSPDGIAWADVPPPAQRFILSLQLQPRS